MKRKHLAIIIAVIMLIAMTIIPIISFADAGDFSSDSDWGGGSDWGSSDWSSSDWDSGSDYSDWDDDYSYSSSGSGFLSGMALGSCLGGGGGCTGSSYLWIAFVIFAIILILIGNAKNKKNKKNGGNRPNNSGNYHQSYAPVNAKARNTDLTKLRETDPAFSKQAFLENARNLYIRVQNAWTDKNLEDVRPQLSGTMYAQLERQLSQLIKNKQTNYVDRIAVLAADIVDYRQDQINDIITVQLKTRITDYTKDDVTGDVIRGSQSRELFMTYEWSFIRTKGKKTPTEESGEKRTTCPSCGAPIDLNHTAKCEYCGAIISTGDYSWVLNEMRGISQRTNG